MNANSNIDLTISVDDESYYDHLYEERERKLKDWQDYNKHRDELNALQSPGNTTIKKILQTK